MKNILLILLCVVFIQCQPTHNNRSLELKKLPDKFKKGELVCVNNLGFIVSSISTAHIGKYYLKMLNCKSEDCIYLVLESEIKKCNNEISNNNDRTF
mgnify:CR=1 FL=1